MRIVSGQLAGGNPDRPSASLCDHVHRRLMETLGDGDASVGGVARSLGLGAPELQRGLREAGTSFGRLVGDVRRQLSMPCGAAGARSVDEIAFLFGFPDPAGTYWVFHRPAAGRTSA